MRLFLLLGFCLVLSGCGQSGPLYLPPAKAAAPVTTGS